MLEFGPIYNVTRRVGTGSPDLLLLLDVDADSGPSRALAKVDMRGFAGY